MAKKKWIPKTGYEMVEAWDIYWKITTIQKMGTKYEADRRMLDPHVVEQFEWAKANPQPSPLSAKRKK